MDQKTNQLWSKKEASKILEAYFLKSLAIRNYWNNLLLFLVLYPYPTFYPIIP